MANNIAHSLRIAHIRTINQRRNPARLIGRKGRSCADQHRASRDHRERCVAVGDVRARDGVIHSNPTARGNPKALAQLDSYKRILVGVFVCQSPALRDGESQRCLPGAERLSLIRLIRIFSLCRIRG